jgi:DNA helicase-2/ATP-dependent DNA helicase PcrA
VHANGLADRIARTIRYHLINGVPEKEICVLGPTWRLVIPLGRALVRALPDCGFDALGLSPIRAQNDSIWYQLARLFLTSPSPERYRARIRWSNSLVRLIEATLGREMPEHLRVPRRILKLTNSIVSEADDGLTYLVEVFAEFFGALEIDIGPGSLFAASQHAFFEAAADRIGSLELDSTVESMRRMFQYPSGVVVNTCHGVKGEEFEVVIAFSLHNNRIPHHSRIEDPNVDESIDARNLLYVISSRAKRHLHLIAETGRRYRRQPCETTPVLNALNYSYDNLDDLI